MAHGQRIEDMSPIDRFAYIVGGLRTLLLRHGQRAPALMLLMHWRLGRTLARFTALASRVQAGTLRPPRRRAPRPQAEADTPETASKPAPWPPVVPVPRRLGWLHRLTLEEYYIDRWLCGASGWAGCFEGFVHSPQMRPLIEAVPGRLGRLLRPLARMLGVTLPAALRLPKRVRARRPQPASRPRPVRRSLPRLCEPVPADLPPAAAPSAPPPKAASKSPAEGPVHGPVPWLPPPPPGCRYVRVRYAEGGSGWAVRRRMEL